MENLGQANFGIDPANNSHEFQEPGGSTPGGIANRPLPKGAPSLMLFEVRGPGQGAVAVPAGRRPPVPPKIPGGSSPGLICGPVFELLLLRFGGTANGEDVDGVYRHVICKAILLLFHTKL